MDSRILELTRNDPRFAYEAYEFVCEAVSYTQDRLGRAAPGESGGGQDRHVSGAELLRYACELAVSEFGMMAAIVFRMWGVRSTDDFGEIVFKLIGIERLSKSERDDPDDFHALFDLERALSDGFRLTPGELPSRGER